MLKAIGCKATGQKRKSQQWFEHSWQFSAFKSINYKIPAGSQVTKLKNTANTKYKQNANKNRAHRVPNLCNIVKTTFINRAASFCTIYHS
jgi:hypothetical protein